jgi:hypothetical protein
MMKFRMYLTGLLLAGFVMASPAQEKSIAVKITNLEKETTTVTNPSTSSSSSCNTSDFPVYQGTELRHIDFADLSWINVRHDLTPSNPNYVSLELTFKDGNTGIYEIVKHIRFTGATAGEKFTLAVKEINTVEIVHSN